MKTKAFPMFLFAAVLAIALAVFLIYSNMNTTPKQDGGKKYNVVMIVSDALRQDVLSCYGGEAQTPNIDWLADNGVLFENSYSTSPWTSPSAVSMFTGNYATSYVYSTKGLHRVETAEPRVFHADWPRIYVPQNEFLFIEVLKQLDYYTGMQIENINAPMHDNLQGFEYIPLHKSSRQVANEVNFITRGGLYDSWQNSAGYRHVFYYLRHLMSMPEEQNFFMLHWILDPHSPYEPVKKFALRIDVDEENLPQPKSYYTKKIEDRENRNETEQTFIKDLYIAEIESVDERVGFVLQVLKHKKLMENTYIVFTSDHGEQFGEHGLYEHGGHGLGCHYYEGLLRVPLIFVGPNLPAGKRIKDRVTLLGLIATFKELLGVEYEDDMQGLSLAPLFFDGTIDNEFLYLDDIQEHDQIDALIENNHKLIAVKDGTYELYDIVNDPREEINLASRDPQLVETMYEKILKMRDENERRRKKNLEVLGDNPGEISETEKQKVLEKLRSLGYVE